MNDADCRQGISNLISTDTRRSVDNSSGNNSEKDFEEQFEGG